MSRGLRMLVGIAVVATWSGTAAADVSGENRARAEQLFESALVDFDADRFEAACPKFAASHAADPKTTTLLNLGRCYQRLGKNASAWAAYREAEFLARRLSRADLEANARAGAASVASSLLRLVIHVPPHSRVEGMSIERDGASIPSAEWEVPIPVDEGAHVITAKAPGRLSWRTEVVVEGGDRTVAVPELVRAPAAPPVYRPFWTPLRTSGAVAAAAGTAATAVGVILGFVAKADYDDARSKCVDGCSRQSVTDAETARSLATTGTIIGIAGAVVGLAGLATVWLAPPAPLRTGASPPRGDRVAVGASLSAGVLGVTGRW